MNLAVIIRLCLLKALVFWLLLTCAAPAAGASVDAPELGRPGPFKVGVRSLTLTQPQQVDILAYNGLLRSAPKGDRVLPIEIWYPASGAHDAPPARYQGDLPTAFPGQFVHFTASGVALRDAPVRTGARYPIVILSHGFNNSPEMMIWLAEGLASKGYVVVGVFHRDPQITDAGKVFGPLMRRPLDLAFVAAQVKSGALGFLSGQLDFDRLALVGYSMGGYGALTAAGATLDPAGLSGKAPGDLMAPYLAGAGGAEDLKVTGVKAVVAISPAGGGHGLSVWGEDGLAKLTTPLLLIVGDQDETVGYSDGVRRIFTGAVHAPRYLLTFRNAGHSIGVDAAPAEMRERLWDFDWFEDPVWRKDRILAINLHMITAFLDLYVQGDASRAAYLNVPTPESNDGVWKKGLLDPYDSFSSGEAPITVWKGFPRRHLAGLELLHAEPETVRP